MACEPSERHRLQHALQTLRPYHTHVVHELILNRIRLLRAMWPYFLICLLNMQGNQAPDKSCVDMAALPCAK